MNNNTTTPNNNDNKKLNNLMNKNVKQYELTLNKIQDIQNEESKLLQQLYSNHKVDNLYMKNNILDRINKLSDLRIDLFKNIQNLYSIVSYNIDTNRKDLVNQMVMVGIVEDQLNVSKNKINSLTDENNNKIRIIEINNYNSSMYSAYSDILMIVIVVCLILLFLVFVRKFLPANIIKIMNIIMILVISFGITFVIIKIMNIYIRSDFDYDKFVWSNPNKNDSSWDNNINMNMNMNSMLPGMCFSDHCCGENTFYDKTINKCIVKPNNTIPIPAKENNNETYESFI